MYELDTIKEVLGDDYRFHPSKTIDEVKRILTTNEMTDNNDVAFMLEAGNLDIEITIYWDDDEHPYLGYYCCLRENGEWSSYGSIDDEVNLDVPDLETEMFRVLDKFAEEQGLSFFKEND